MSCSQNDLIAFIGFCPEPFMPVYTASKHGVVGFTRAMAEV